MIDLIGHPFSSYTWKAEIALIEKGADYRLCALTDEHPEHWTTLRTAWPVGQFPLIVDGDVTLFESSIIIEYADALSDSGPRLVPADPAAALRVRLLDRLFDNHFQARFQAVVGEYLPFITATPDQMRIDRARDLLEKAYGWLEAQLGDDEWATPWGFTMADCSAAPALFYADWVHPIDAAYPRVKAYRARLLARPSVSHCVEAARPFRHYFPLDVAGRD